MCLIAWNWQPDSETPLLLLGNRDEYYARPALPLHCWDDAEVLAGKDLQAGGTWLGVGRGGRVAALTNYRLPVADPAPKPSRGMLTTRFLQGNASAKTYLEALAPQAGVYNPFNLLVWDGEELLGLESRNQRIVTLRPGIGGVSNADFDTPWPKLLRLKSALQQQCAQGLTQAEDLLPLLQDRSKAAYAELPDTGVPIEIEHMLSAAFVSSAAYGTRASSILTLNRKKSTFFEQGYGAQGTLAATKQFFTI